ncbi:hypothetical protein [Streptococcus ruminantium]|uniref:hypothetical protein n=1 Tax=Streptococcus ruminantium TaxID=1917441 RepID=UPI0012DD8A90|nr:hypothetical protein [Streptococcus ruminantium]
MITDKDYNRIADKVYSVDSGKESFPVEKGDKSLGQFKVLKVEDNLTNGMQAMMATMMEVCL